MENILEKLDSYNILNNLLPGVILDYLLKKMLGFDLVEGSILENLFLYYFLGMIVSRIGSHVIEPICKKIKWVNKNNRKKPYELFSSYKKQFHNPKGN